MNLEVYSVTLVSKRTTAPNVVLDEDLYLRIHAEADSPLETVEAANAARIWVADLGPRPERFSHSAGRVALFAHENMVLSHDTPIHGFNLQKTAEEFIGLLTRILSTKEWWMRQEDGIWVLQYDYHVLGS